MAKRRPYQEVQDLVNQHGGTMEHVRAGYQWGAWIVRLKGKRRVFESNGNGYPEIDHLYKTKPGVTNPTHWSDYSLELIPNAWEKFITYL